MNRFTENSLIKNISRNIRIWNKNVFKGIGDDAAVVIKDKDTYSLYTCDSLVSGVHFSEKDFSPYQIGRKAAAVNLSDIASMGGNPKHILVSLFLQKKTTEKFVNELYKGLIDECSKYNVEIIGGNIARSNQFIIDLFLTGEVISKNLVLRSGAQVRDAVVVTGNLGNNASKLYRLIPIPRVKEGILLGKSGLVTSMIDISDGLSSDIQHICDESKVGVEIYLEKLPVSKGVEKITALNGGEDCELCFTASPENILKLSKLFKTKITVIGEIISSKKGRWLIDQKGKKNKLIPKGWDHFIMVSEIEP